MDLSKPLSSEGQGVERRPATPRQKLMNVIAYAIAASVGVAFLTAIWWGILAMWAAIRSIP